MTTRKSRKIVIQITIILAFIFSLVIAYSARGTGMSSMLLIFMAGLQVIVLLSILYVLETVIEIIEVK
jgi:hypothetical protein